MPTVRSNWRNPGMDWLRFLIIAALLAGVTLFLRSRGAAENLPPRESLGTLPYQISNWRGTEVPIPPRIIEVLGVGEFLDRVYSRNGNEPPIGFFVAYFPSQRMGSTMHSPQNCLPGSGWTPVDFSRVNLSQLKQDKIEVNRYVLSKGLDKMLVLYWYQAHGRVTTSEYWAKFYLVADAIRMNRSDGALVRVTTPIARGESVHTAEQRGAAFIQDVAPLLSRYIPR